MQADRKPHPLLARIEALEAKAAVQRRGEVAEPWLLLVAEMNRLARVKQASGVPDGWLWEHLQGEKRRGA